MRSPEQAFGNEISAEVDAGIAEQGQREGDA